MAFWQTVIQKYAREVLWFSKVEKIKEDSLDSISSLLTSVKIQIIGGKVYLRE